MSFTDSFERDLIYGGVCLFICEKQQKNIPYYTSLNMAFIRTVI
jgi:hypothetical protein